MLSLPPQHLLSNLELDDEDYDGGSDNIVLHCGYIRPRLITVDLDNDDVGDYVAQRLAIAREKAMQAYKEKWA